jgi:ubiquinone/menaquinone biosynthesis C-methylase UbiE
MKKNSNLLSRLSPSPRIVENSAYGFSVLRSLNYTGQFLLLPIIEKIASGTDKSQPEQFPLKIKEAYLEILEVLKSDSKNIALGLYPIEVLKPQRPTDHVRSLVNVLKDGFKIAKRRKEKKAHDFSSEETEKLGDIPDYARRNFHFQTGGYASTESAELYEHQVEMLFSGSADAMRRLIIAPLKQATGWSDGEGLKFLEVGAGTGRLTKFMKLAFPKARIVATDMSDAYLKISRERLKNFEKIDFMQCWGEDLPFPDQSFDFVYSCFLYHELPREIRRKVIQQSCRVLKPDGLFGLVDSIQKGDEPKLNWALDLFPQDFHEPFYKNYQNHPLEAELKQLGLELVDNQRGFLSKAILAKPI